MIKFAELKKLFFYLLIGSLIAAATVAVITVLVGEFDQTASRVLFTLFMVILHSLVSLGFIWDNERQNTFERLAFFTNVLFIIIIFSFFVSILWIWELIESDFAVKIYQTYFILGFASLHADILSKIVKKKLYLDYIVYFNYLFIAIVVVMLLPIIHLSNPYAALGELYYRFLAAAGIVDGTLSILAIIFFKLYLHKHPKEQDALAGKQKKGLSFWVWILLIYLLFQFIAPMMLGFGFMLFGYL